MGYDPLLNLVLDNTIEYQKGMKNRAMKGGGGEYNINMI